MWPLRNTSRTWNSKFYFGTSVANVNGWWKLTLECSSGPSRVTRSCMLFFSRISSSKLRLGPSPPIRKFTFFIWTSFDITPAIKSTPLRYTNRETITTVTDRKIGYFIDVSFNWSISPCWLWASAMRRSFGFGVKYAVSTAFGITETFSLGTLARNTVFSLPVCDTQMQWLHVDSVISSNLLVTTADKSAKPKRLWSVNTTCKPHLNETVITLI